MPTSSLGVRIGARVRARREAIDWSQAELAEAAGVTPNYVGVVERGEKLPTLETLEAFARALGTPADALLTEQQPDDWADEVTALARAVPASHRRMVVAVLRAAVTEARAEARRTTRHAAANAGSPLPVSERRRKRTSK